MAQDQMADSSTVYGYPRAGASTVSARSSVETLPDDLVTNNTNTNTIGRKTGDHLRIEAQGTLLISREPLQQQHQPKWHEACDLAVETACKMWKDLSVG